MKTFAKMMIGATAMTAMVATLSLMNSDDAKMKRKLHKVVNGAIDSAIDTVNDTATKISSTMKHTMK